MTRDTLLFVFVSNDPYTRCYDLDLLRELRSEGLAGRVIAITARAQDAIAEGEYLHVPHVAEAGDGTLLPVHRLGQIYAFHRSLALGNRPDRPRQFGQRQPRRTRRDHTFAVTEAAALYLGVDGGGSKTALTLIIQTAPSERRTWRRALTTSPSGWMPSVLCSRTPWAACWPRRRSALRIWILPFWAARLWRG